MPAYVQSSASNPITGIRRGDLPVAVWSAESLVSGEFSQALALAIADAYNTAGGQYVRVTLVFSAAPGAFTIQIQTADQDVPANYTNEPFGGATPGQITTVGANNSVSISLEPIVARFIRLYCVTQPANAVTCTATIMRG